MAQQENNFRRRKRKKNFLQITKKYAKRGHYGHGAHIDQESFDYYCRIVELVNKKDIFETPEDKTIFANNALGQSVGKEVELSSNQVVSRAFELIFPFADINHQQTFEQGIMKNLRLAFVDRFCSHVTQLVVTNSAKRVLDGKEEINDSFVHKCCKFAINNIEEFSSDVYACHVVRTCLDAIKDLREQMSSELAEQAYRTLIESSLFVDLSQHELGSGLLQHLLRCLHTCAPKLCQKTIKLLTSRVFDPQLSNEYTEQSEAKETVDLVDNKEENDKMDEDKKLSEKNELVPFVFETPSTSRLLEAAIECSRGKTFTKLYAVIFINRFHLIGMHEVGNFSLQKLIKSCSDASEFEGIFEEASKCLEAAINCGHTGVAVALGQACRSLGTHQGDFINCLLKALKCNEQMEDKLCIAVAKLSSDVTLKPDEHPASLHGSLILQEILQFKKPIKVIKSMLSTDSSFIVRLFSDTRGSHVADAFFSGPFVGEKKKEQMVTKLKSHLVELACSKHGSRAIDAAWKTAGQKSQQIIAETLATGGAKLNTTPWGRKVSTLVNLEEFRSNRTAWFKHASEQRNRLKLIGGLLEES